MVEQVLDFVFIFLNLYLVLGHHYFTLILMTFISLWTRENVRRGKECLVEKDRKTNRFFSLKGYFNLCSGVVQEI